MSNVFSSLTGNGLEESQDRLGGFSLLDTDIYVGTIKMAYGGSSASGALNVTLVFDFDGQEYRETVYVTNKDKQNFYLTQNNKKAPLPGFTTVEDVCLIATNTPLSEQNIEDKSIKVFDFEQKTEVLQTVPMFVDLLNKPIAVGIKKRIVNKKTKADDGSYVDTAETREENFIDKIFHPELKLTVAEARHEKPADFWDKWIAANQGKVFDKTKKVAGGAKPASTQAAPRKSLFAK